jgi:hypothetical protein
MVSMPRSSEAFISTNRPSSRYRGPKSSWAKAWAVAVFPVPGGPVKSMCGTFFVVTMFFNAFTTFLLVYYVVKPPRPVFLNPW